MHTSHRVLIADDDAGVRSALEAVLSCEGYELAFASSGPEALERAASFTPDLLLLDVMMPGMDGYAVCQRLRADPLLAEVPVIMITALDDHASRLRGIEAGADDFITKPFDDTELQARVRTVVRLNRYRRLLVERSQREQAEEALALRVTQLALLNKIGGKIAAVLELDGMLAEAAHLTQEFGYPHVALFTLEPESGELQLRACASGLAPELPPMHRLGRARGVAGWVARHGEKLLVNDVAAEPHYFPIFPEEAGIRSELAVPLRVAGEVIGVFDVRSPRLNAFDENDVMVMETLADQIASAIQNARLYEAERAARERLRDLAGYLETAREKERTAIAREIHDEFGQALTALKMDAAWLARHLSPDSPALRDKVRAMSELIDSSIHMVRRIATDLRPGVLDHLGLNTAIEWQAQELATRAGFECELHLSDQEPELDPDLATAIFRIFQETMTNIARHAEATRVRVELRDESEELTLIVRDNGRGITRQQRSDPKSLGLIGMQERARSWSGDVTFQATAGQGTTVIVRVPREGSEEEK
jgi:signal transduction histidine kinase/CheY-like chemotaxis protein